ncbi:hypothetical protein ARMSODRAFT_1078394 [Armillaria solidipes]|uniref:Uncharacterized protein n=1 Tax=Armillaria solidipes TaxID=1076256 RepID=A0A2H3CLM7_9AGAR|nr:hypothetical protein ARMSODRAFT_1078394 [Armillaria solidipes]
MDRFYDKEEAAQAIKLLIKERCGKDAKHLSRILKDPDVLDSVSVEKDDAENIWKLVFTATGVIIAQDLPPVARESRISKDEIRFLSQYVRISGMGSIAFEDTIIALKGIQQLGEREFQEGSLEEWTQFTVQGHDAIEFSNRYFTPCSQAINGDSVRFPMDVDPNGVPQKMAGTQWIHAEDNEVRYYRGVIDIGKKRYMVAKPQTFRVGDIVEIQMSMVFVKDKRGLVKMKTILRAIALVNCDLTMKADRDRKQHTGSTPTTSFSRMKRKIGFEDDEEEDLTGHRGKRHEEERVEEMMTDD